MDDILPTSREIDPVNFLKVEMDLQHEISLNSGIVLSPSPTNLQRLQEVSDLFTSGENLPGAEITPVVTPVNKTDIIQPHLPMNNSLIEIDSFPGHIVDKRHECNVCSTEFDNSENLKQHMITHSIREVLHAEVLQQSVTMEIASHVIASPNKEVIMSIDMRRHECTVCHYKFKRAEHLRRHMSRSHPEEFALITATKNLAKARRRSTKKPEVKVGQEKSDETSPFITDLDKSQFDDRKFACSICDFKFKRRDHLNRHMIVHADQTEAGNNIDIGHDKESLCWSTFRRFCCNFCDAKFRRADHLKRHLSTHFDLMQTSFMFSEHVEEGESSTQNDPFNISDTGLIIKEEIMDEDEISNSENNIEKMVSSMDGELVKEQMMGAECSKDENKNMDVPKRKKDTGNQDRPYGCEFCGYKFKRRYHLRRHLAQHIKISVKDDKEPAECASNTTESLGSFKCTICPAVFKQDYLLKSHLAKHPEIRPYPCSVCSYRGKFASSLKKHLLTHTDEKPYACHLCDYKGKILSSLKDHLSLVHTEQKPYPCDFCDFKAKTPSHLKKHLVTHQADAPYQCDLCDFKAKRAGNLKEHMGTHTNEKTFMCSLCDYGTHRQRNLRKHMATHFDEKPFACDSCSYRAKLPQYLKDHMKTHMNIKPYTCPFCDYSFSQLRQLKKHIQSLHDGFIANSMDICDLTDYKIDSE